MTGDLFERWILLLEELDIINQMYLYAVSKNGMPRDVSLAFAVELAEPMVEILVARKKLPANTRRQTLKECLEALLVEYDNVVFDKETSADSDGFLDKLKNNRVRIMHIKHNQKKEKCFDGTHCVLYLCKLSLLYRSIPLDLFDISACAYKDKLKMNAAALDAWAENL